MEMMENWLALRHLERQLQADLEQALRQASYVMTLNEFHVLYVLNDSQGRKLQISEISEKIGLSISATSRMLVRFEETCGVIERHICAQDKRGVEIALTDLGKERLEIALKAVQPVLEQYQKQLAQITKEKLNC